MLFGDRQHALFINSEEGFGLGVRAPMESPDWDEGVEWADGIGQVGFSLAGDPMDMVSFDGGGIAGKKKNSFIGIA